MKLFFLTLAAWAQENGVEHMAGNADHSVPWNSIMVQTLNFTVLFGFLFWVLRKTVIKHFIERAKSYRELVDRAENARREAEASHGKIKKRLEQLEASSEQSLARARSEAAELRARLMEEAKVLGRKLEQEAQRSTLLELEKAKAELRYDLLGKALKTSEETLKKGLDVSQQKKLQDEFVEKIEVVSR